MRGHNKTIGDIGETLATERYQASGFTILAVKARTKSGEIDIIAQKDGHTHFIEVKTRTNDKMGNPEEAITPRRHARMITCAEEFAMDHPVTSFQIDVVSINLHKTKEAEVLIFENI